MGLQYLLALQELRESAGHILTPFFLVVSDLSREEIGETTLPFEDLEGITDAILQNAQ